MENTNAEVAQTALVTSWYRKNLGDAMLAESELDRIREECLACYGTELQLAMFTRHESEGQLHCDLVLYLPPGMKELAELIQAKPCAQPSAAGLNSVVW